MNPIKKEIYKFHEELYRYIRSNPQTGGMELLDKFEKLLLNNDLFFGSKKEIKEKIGVILKEEENYVSFKTGILIEKNIPKYDFKLSNVTKEEAIKITKEEFVSALEMDWLGKDFII